jgi:ribose transport system substrate-binding protein
MNKKKFIIGFIVMIVFMITVASVNIYKLKTDKIEVAVIVKSTTSSFWQQFMSGLQAGTAEYNVNYYCEAPDSEEDVQTQLELMQKAIDSKVDAIIISAVSAEDSVPLIEEAKKKGIYVVIVNSGVDTENYDVEIGTDNLEAGHQLADEVVNADEDTKYVGIINFDESAANAQQREQGFRDAVEREENIKIVASVNVPSNVSEAKEATLKMMEEHPEINTIITMNEWTTLGVGYAVEEIDGGKNIHVYGFDSNTLCLDMLEKGYLDGLLVQNPYAMGYLAMENAYSLSKHKKASEKVIYTNTEMVTRENMYDSDMQKLIFPVKE